MDCKYLSTLLLLALFAVLAAGEDAPNIVNGPLKYIDQYPYQVAITGKRKINNYVSWTSRCGGALIALDTVLTAAHCVMAEDSDKLYDAKDYTVTAGTNNREDKYQGREIKVSEIYVHKNYKIILNSYGNVSDVKSDIAILKLEKSFTAGLDIDTVKLPDEFDNFKGRVGTVTGYGVNRVSLERSSSGWDYIKKSDYNLRSLQIKIMDDCKSPDVQICGISSGEWSGTCQGDSGGPLVVDHKVVGIVSYGSDSCNDNISPGSFTKVTHFVNSIRDVMNGRNSTQYKKYKVQEELDKLNKPIQENRSPVAQRPPAIRTTTKRPSTEFDKLFPPFYLGAITPSPKRPIINIIQKYDQLIEKFEYLVSMMESSSPVNVERWKGILNNFYSKLLNVAPYSQDHLNLYSPLLNELEPEYENIKRQYYLYTAKFSSFNFPFWK